MFQIALCEPSYAENLHCAYCGVNQWALLSPAGVGEIRISLVVSNLFLFFFRLNVISVLAPWGAAASYLCRLARRMNICETPCFGQESAALRDLLGLTVPLNAE